MAKPLGVPYRRAVVAPVTDFKVGDRVFFGRKNGEKTEGTIIKVNRKTYKVQAAEMRGTYRDRSAGTAWSVDKRICTKASEGRPARITEKRSAKRPCLVDVTTGKRTYGYSGESEDSLFGRMANGLL